MYTQEPAEKAQMSELGSMLMSRLPTLPLAEDDILGDLAADAEFTRQSTPTGQPSAQTKRRVNSSPQHSVTGRGRRISEEGEEEEEEEDFEVTSTMLDKALGDRAAPAPAPMRQRKLLEESPRTYKSSKQSQ